MTLKNGFRKCWFFVLSANGWKDQNMDSSLSGQRKPWYGEAIVWLASRIEYDVKAKCRLISRKFFGHEVFSAESSLNHPKATRVCIRSINQSARSISVRFLLLFCLRVCISRSYENRSIFYNVQNRQTCFVLFRTRWWSGRSCSLLKFDITGDTSRQ